MSGTVDTRTVEMRFDNKNFESNVKQSMSTLDKLKQKLKLKGASKGLTEVEKSSKKLDFRDTGGSVLKLGKKFSILEEMAKGAFRRMGSEAYTQGLKIVKSLSIDQITAGWDKYAQKTTAVQTIMANIKDDTGKFIDEAAKMDYVNKSLEKLQWFSDETSYSFTDMTGNVGKFIANGQDLEQSVTAMQGIATWAAMSGQNAQTASRAMYNISQAMGVGSMKIKDWMSIENANMATAQFKELAITIGQKKGKIKQGQVTIENFRESLSGSGTKDWFDKEVMMEVFETYGEAANRIQEYAKAHNVTSTEAIREIKKTDKTFADSLSFKAFAAAQEAKTFGEVVSATADAASTKWLQFFENIFGNYLQAKELWTNLSEDLYDIFVEPLNTLNEIMGIWNRGFSEDGPRDSIEEAFELGKLPGYTLYKDLLSGRELLISGFKNIIDTLFHDVEDEDGNKVLSILGTIKEAFREAFYPDDDNFSIAKRLWDLTKRFRDFTERMKPSLETIEKIKNVFKGLFTIFKIAGKFIGAIIKPFKELFGKIFGAEPGKGLLNSLDSFSTWIQELDKSLDEEGIFDKVSQGIRDGIQKVIDALNWVSEKLTGLSISDLFNKIKTDVTDFFKDFDFKEKFEKIGNFFSGIFSEIGQVETGDISGKLTPLQNFWIGLKGFAEGLMGVLTFIFEKVIPFLANVFGKIGEFFGKIFGKLSGKSAKSGANDAASDIEELGDTVEDIGEKVEETAEKVNPVLSFLGKIFEGIKGFFQKASPFFEALGEWIKTALGKFGEFLGGLAKDGKLGQNVTNFAKGGFFISLLLLINNIRKISKEFKGLGGAVKGMFSSGFGIKSLFDNISGLVTDVRERFKKRNKLNAFRSIAVSMLLIAGALILVAQAFKVFAKIKFENAPVGVIAAIFAGFIAVSVLVALASKKIFTEKKDTKALYSMITFMAALAVILTLVSNSFKQFAKIEFKNAPVGVIAAIFAGFIGITTLVAWAATKFAKNKTAERALLLMASFMMSVAQALVVLSLALRIAGNVDADSTSLAIIGLIFAGFIGITTLVAWAATKFAKNKTSEKALSFMAGFMMSVATALIPLAIALRIAGNVKADSTSLAIIGLIFAGFIGITTLVAWAATKFAKNKTSEKALSFMAGFMMSVATALIPLAIALWIVGKANFDPGSLVVVGLIFAGFIGITTLVAWAATKFAKNKTAERALPLMAGFMMSVATALVILAAAFAVFSLIDFEKIPIGTISLIFAGFIVLTAGIAILGGILMKNGTSIAGIAMMAGFMLTAAASLVIVAYAFSQLATGISPDQMKAALAIMITFAAIVALLAVIGTILAATGVGVVGMAMVAVIILAIGTACLMAGVGIALMVSSITSLIDSLAKLMQAIATYGPGFVMNLKMVANAMLDTIISLAPKMETAALVVIKTLASAFIKALPIVSKALVLLLIYLMQNVRETLSTTVPILVMTIIDLIDTLANTLRASAPLLTSAVRNLIEAIIETVIISIAGIVEPFGSVGEWIAEKITGWIPGLREAFKVAEDTDTVLNHIGETEGTDIDISVGDPDSAAKSGENDANAYLEAFRNGTESVEKGDLVNSLLGDYSVDTDSLLGGSVDTDSLLGGSIDTDSLLGGMGDTSMFSDVMTGKMGDMTEAIEEETPKTREASAKMAEAIQDPITALDAHKWGEDIGRNLSNGLYSKLGSIQTAANATAQVIHDILGFSEPKKGPLSDFHTYAPDMIRLWCQGVKQNIGMVSNSSDSIAAKADEGFSSALDYISKLIDGGMTDDLTIRPIMDLSEIENGVSMIDSMLKKESGYPIYGTSNLSSAAAYNMRYANGVGTQPIQQISKAGDTYNNTFNIQNSDPEATARAVMRIITNQTIRKQAAYDR